MTEGERFIRRNFHGWDQVPITLKIGIIRDYIKMVSRLLETDPRKLSAGPAMFRPFALERIGQFRDYLAELENPSKPKEPEVTRKPNPWFTGEPGQSRYLPVEVEVYVITEDQLADLIRKETQ